MVPWARVKAAYLRFSRFFAAHGRDEDIGRSRNVKACIGTARISYCVRRGGQHQYSSEETTRRRGLRSRCLW